MTLTVTAYRIVRSAEGEQNDPIAISSNLAGVEEARTSFYGATAERLGLVILPRLVASDLWVGGSELGALRAEVGRLMADLTAEEKPYWELRLSNILEAIEEASAHGSDGLVVIE